MLITIAFQCRFPLERAIWVSQVGEEITVPLGINKTRNNKVNLLQLSNKIKEVYNGWSKIQSIRMLLNSSRDRIDPPASLPLPGLHTLNKDRITRDIK